ncbi:MAG TPA: hypothetical protein VK661_11450 [Planctomycetota bacterium]|nr:hypothetical protein [Planctomycetota bacterium]
MKRSPFIVAGIVLAAFFGFQSLVLLTREPAHPRASMADDDYPLEEGLTWVYKSSMGLQVVRRVVGRGALHWESTLASWHVMQFDLPLLGRKRLLMQRTDDGVVAHSDNIGDVQQLIMRFPMKVGDTWTIDFPNEDLAECTVLEPEAIDVLSKRALASKLRVVRTHRKTGKKTTDYEWYVRGIGLAKMEVTFGLKATFNLIRFERAAASGGPPSPQKE